MKRILVGLGAVITILVVGCGSNAELTKKEAEYDEVIIEDNTANQEVIKEIENDKYTQYDELINMIEEEDYDGAVAYINNLRPEPTYVTIDLTPENILDYYDLGIVYEEHNNADAYGAVYNFDYVTEYRLYLKEEYEDCLIDKENTHLSVGVEYDYSLIPAGFNDDYTDLIIDYGGTCLVSDLDFDFYESFYKHVSKMCISGTDGWADNLGVDSVTAWDPDGKVFSGGNFFELKAEDKDCHFYLVSPANIKIITVEGSITLENKG